MTDDGVDPTADGQPTVEQAALAAEAVAPAAVAPLPPAPASTLDERPELVVGGAFAGGLVLALLLKRLAR
ncbi:MAG: hypothetical protein JSS99_16090 [Actinobacteria bacterium]|nr:hypothetical protein [Actinomycetota bacterium]